MCFQYQYAFNVLPAEWSMWMILYGDFLYKESSFATVGAQNIPWDALNIYSAKSKHQFLY